MSTTSRLNKRIRRIAREVFADPERLYEVFEREGFIVELTLKK